MPRMTNAPQSTPPPVLATGPLRIQFDGRLLFNGLMVQIVTGLNAITGDEQTGKTTLLRALCNQAPPDQTKPIATPAFGLLFEPPHPGDPTPDDLWRAAQARCPHWSEQACSDLIDRLAFAPHRHKTLSMMSTGTRRKVETIAVLASGAAVMCLDQPYASLDKPSIDALRDHFRTIGQHTDQALVIADYEPDPRLHWQQVIAL